MHSVFHTSFKAHENILFQLFLQLLEQLNTCFYNLSFLPPLPEICRVHEIHPWYMFTRLLCAIKCRIAS